eukprot:symbB.v1.2.025510.t1/scaffold2452.1/size150514/11
MCTLVAFVAPPRRLATDATSVQRPATSEVKEEVAMKSNLYASESNSTAAGSDEVTTEFWSLTDSDRSLTTKGRFLDRSVAVLVLGLVTADALIEDNHGRTARSYAETHSNHPQKTETLKLLAADEKNQRKVLGDAQKKQRAAEVKAEKAQVHHCVP